MDESGVASDLQLSFFGQSAIMVPCTIALSHCDLPTPRVSSILREVKLSNSLLDIYIAHLALESHER